MVCRANFGCCRVFCLGINLTNERITKWTKQNVQKVLRQLRGLKSPEGKLVFVVTKNDFSYEVKSVKNGQLVFSAMNGRFDYLVRFDNRLFNAQGGRANSG